MNASLRPIIRFTSGLAQETARQTERLARNVAGGAAGIFQEARHGRSAPKPGMDDVTLARKVETELFRPRGAPKGSVDVNVVEGVVYLRGEVKRPAQIKSLEQRVRQIPEVRGVENLLHLPKTPSPTRADSPRRVQKNPPSPKPKPRKRTTATRTRVTAEAPTRARGRTRAPARGTRTGAAAGAGETPATAPTPPASSGAPPSATRPARPTPPAPPTPAAPQTGEPGFKPGATAGNSGQAGPDPTAGAGGSTELKPDA